MKLYYAKVWFCPSQARLSLRSWLCSTNPPRIKRHRSLLQRKLNVSVVASSTLTSFVALLGGLLGLLLHSDKPFITLTLSFTMSSLLRHFVSHSLHFSLRKIRTHLALNATARFCGQKRGFVRRKLDSHFVRGSARWVKKIHSFVSGSFSAS